MHEPHVTCTTGLTRLHKEPHLQHIKPHFCSVKFLNLKRLLLCCWSVGRSFLKKNQQTEKEQRRRTLVRDVETTS